MKRRVCETCFYYEAAGLANSGWCRHPNRQFSTDVRLVVRGNETGCRNGWDADLWVPVGIDPATGETFDESPGDFEPMGDQITSIVPARYDVSDRSPLVQNGSEDVVVRHAPYPEYSAPEKEARDLVTNPRAAILKAREQFKVRQRREGRIADQPEPVIQSIDPAGDYPLPSSDNRGDHNQEYDDSWQENAPFLAEGSQSARRPLENTVPPVTREEVRRPYPTITHFAEDAPRFESVPDSLANIPAPQESRVVQRFIDEPEETDYDLDNEFDDWFDDQRFDENGHSSPSIKPRRESIINRFLRERRERRHQDVEDDYREIDDFAPGVAYENPDLDDRPPEFEPERYRPIEARNAEFPHSDYESAPARASRIPELAVSSRVADVFESSIDPFEEPCDFPPEDSLTPNDSRRKTGAVAAGYQIQIAEGLPRWDGFDRPLEEYTRPAPSFEPLPSIAPDLPRICRTCRDFRPAESGERGWCNNLWAFKHRRMVDADLLSCESSYGTWWAAHDGVWQKSADVSRHALETPLLDRLLASLSGSPGPPMRRAAGSGR